MSKFFKIGEKLNKKPTLFIEIFGLILFLAVWYVFTIPHDTVSLTFGSFPSPDVNFEWTGPDGFKESFPGDNSMDKLKPGSYEFTATDTLGRKITGKVTVPEKADKTMDTVFHYSIAGGSDYSVKVEVEPKKDGIIGKAILPPPLMVLKSFKELHFKDFVVKETLFSLKLNVFGYIEAILLSVLFGFILALVPFFRAMFSRWVNAIRFIPLTAVTGLFIAWFGIESNMKVQFLMFGILVYLLPVIIQRIDDVDKIHLQTAFTLGASKWQLIKTIYFPSVASKIIDDIRVLTAISWTYIIIAEMLNQTGGVGALIHLSARQSRLDKVFALLIIIVLIGIIQDRLFAWLDKKLFKFKYQALPKF
jgi:ABC-type nitrate/sulfonate/bicarbonate transport system permease component